MFILMKHKPFSLYIKFIKKEKAKEIADIQHKQYTQILKISIYEKRHKYVWLWHISYMLWCKKTLRGISICLSLWGIQCVKKHARQTPFWQRSKSFGTHFIYASLVWKCALWKAFKNYVGGLQFSIFGCFEDEKKKKRMLVDTVNKTHHGGQYDKNMDMHRMES